MILSNKQITKVLIRLRRCAGWSAPLLFSVVCGHVFSRQGPYDIVHKIYQINYYCNNMYIPEVIQSTCNLVIIWWIPLITLRSSEITQCVPLITLKQSVIKLQTVENTEVISDCSVQTIDNT